jgi:hypothetical protein
MEHEEQHHEEVPLQVDSSGPSDGFFRDTITSPGALGSHHGGHSEYSLHSKGQQHCCSTPRQQQQQLQQFTKGRKSPQQEENLTCFTL